VSLPGHVGPKVDPGWWDFLRQVVMFALAVFLILYSVFTPGYDIPFIVTGLILFGLVPADRFLMRKSDEKKPGDGSHDS
jgi:hypothetical protein